MPCLGLLSRQSSPGPDLSPGAGRDGQGRDHFLMDLTDRESMS